MDYNTLNNLCSTNLYNLYHSNIRISYKLGEKKIIDNVSIPKIVIYNSKKTEEEHKVNVMVEIRNISYTQNSNGKIISGSTGTPISEEFDVTFIKKLKSTKSRDSLRCPNCGAVVNTNKCEYCKTEFEDYDFKIDSFKKLVEK